VRRARKERQVWKVHAVAGVQKVEGEEKANLDYLVYLGTKVMSVNPVCLELTVRMAYRAQMVWMEDQGIRALKDHRVHLEQKAKLAI
jgi:hypothetical protein